MNKLNFHQLSLSEFANQMEEAHFNINIAKKVYHAIFKHGINYLNENKNISQKTRDWINANYDLGLPMIVNTLKSNDGTVKFLIELSDGNRIESVLIPFHKKYTLCISTQVGCAMNCSFCFTATEGFIRHLKISEIIAQYLLCYRWLKEQRHQHTPRPNLVLMGQGEPLHNFDNVKTAIELMIQSDGIHLGERQITLSTCGYLPGLKRLNELPPINIALSLHSAFNEKRSELIPINNAYSIEIILDELKKLKLKKRQYINIEYLLIQNFNDTSRDADKLYEVLSGLPVIINLIPFNPFDGTKYLRPTKNRIEEFKKILVAHKFRVMVRTTKGDEIKAACGQLKGNTANV